MGSSLQSKRENTAALKKIMGIFNRRSVFIVSCFFFLLFFSLILTDGLVALGRIHPGIKIGDTYVGGLTTDQAGKKLESRLSRALKKPVYIVYEDDHWEVTPDQFNIQVSVEKSIDRAYALGREEGLLNRLRQRLACWINAKKISHIYSIDHKSMSSFIDEMSKQINKDPVDATILFENDEPKIAPSQIGITLNKPETFSLIKTKLVSSKNRKIEPPVTMIPVDITEDNAKDALKDTKEMVQYPLTLNYEERMWQIESQEIRNLLRFIKTKKGRKPKLVKLNAELDPDKVKKYIAELTQDINVEPQNARFQVDGATVNIISSQNGHKVDANAALAKMKKAVFTDAPRQVFLSTNVVEPDRTTEEAKAMGIKKRISSFSTTFSSSNAPRVNNIILLSKSLDDTLVAAGKVFSFNQSTGSRTADKGYKEAPTIVRGELVPSIGGGICQVATTLFNTVFFAGYPVATRSNHSFYISHYPAGRDATVGWGGPDFKFENDTDAYFLIKTWASSSSVTVAIYSTDYDTNVSYKSSDFTNYKEFSTKNVEDPTLPLDQEVVKTSGIKGRDITVYRTVKRGGKVIREDKFFSRYKPRRAVIRVGTMEAAPIDEATTEETQTAE